MQMSSSGMFSSFFALFPNNWLYPSLPNRHLPHPTPQLPDAITPRGDTRTGQEQSPGLPLFNTIALENGKIEKVCNHLINIKGTVCIFRFEEFQLSFTLNVLHTLCRVHPTAQ